MRIAFVGKGGSGKTTFASLFTQCCLQTDVGNIWVVDADLNMHMAEQLGIETVGLKHVSDLDSEEDIKRYLIGKSSRIESSSHFKKSTPPSQDSNFILVKDSSNYILENYAARRGNLFLSIVGSYHADGIGASCYHNNLAILESMLSHTIDKDATVIVDMVAGVDAFAGTLHAQFDMIVLVVEPTKKSLEVYEQYKRLAEEAGIWQTVFVVSNKIFSAKDAEFIAANVDSTKLLGNMSLSEHIRQVEQGESPLDFSQLEELDKEIFINIRQQLSRTEISFNDRLTKLHKLHEKYVAQGHVKERFGDLSNQIDADFNFDELVKRHG